MNKKQVIEKAVRIRSELVMLCQVMPPEQEKMAEDMIPVMDKILDELSCNAHAST